MRTAIHPRTPLALALASVLATVGCLRSTEYRCSTNAECGATGTCQPLGYCSLPDGSCSGGARFSDSAGSHAGQCVDDATLDAGLDDARPDDAPVDGAGPICPTGYITLAGAQPSHRYRLLTNATGWTAQQTACAATSPTAYLAVPDDLVELQALATHAAVARFWIGLTDAATEGTWLTVKGAPAPFLPWVPGAPDNLPPNENCAEIVSATSQINDERCNTSYVAICECE